MSGFDEREQAFESKFAHDQELEFRVHARTGRYLGLWAADHHGAKDAEGYAAEIAALAAGPGKLDAAVKRVAVDLSGHNVTAHAVERHAEQCLGRARADVMQA